MAADRRSVLAGVAAAFAAPVVRMLKLSDEEVMERLRQGLDTDANAVVDADTTLKLVEAVRGLAVRHGEAAVDHCVRMVNDLKRLLDWITGTASPRRD